MKRWPSAWFGWTTSKTIGSGFRPPGAGSAGALLKFETIGQSTQFLNRMDRHTISGLASCDAALLVVFVHPAGCVRCRWVIRLSAGGVPHTGVLVAV